MEDFEVIFYEGDAIKPEHDAHLVKQVSVWLITSDKKFLIVSKDGKKWQLPGGKPGVGESLIQSGVRELYEETGLVLDESWGLPRVFGYCLINHLRDSEIIESFLQVRLMICIDIESYELKTSTDFEDNLQAEEEKIRFIKAVSPTEGEELISWLKTTGEYIWLKSNNFL